MSLCLWASQFIFFPSFPAWNPSQSPSSEINDVQGALHRGPSAKQSSFEYAAAQPAQTRLLCTFQFVY